MSDRWTDHTRLVRGRSQRDAPAQVGLLLGLALVLAACGAHPTTSSVSAGTPSPAPGGSTVYVAAGSLYALRPSDGKQLWRYGGEPNGELGMPAVVGGIIYIAHDNVVYARNADNRSLLWQRSLDYGVNGGLVVSNGTAYGSVSTRKDVTPAYAAVCALRASDGALAWCHQVGDPVYGRPAVVDGVVYFGSTDGYAYALRAGDGTLLWRSKTGDMIWTSPQVANGVMYVTSYDDYLYALRADDGKQLWRFHAGAVSNDAAVAAGVVYEGTHDSGLYALRGGDGSVLWHRPLGAPARTVMTTGGVVYVGASDGTAYAFAASDGTRQWTAPIGWFDPAPMVANGLVIADRCDCPTFPYDSNPPGEVFAFSAADGTVRWDVHLPVAPMGPPVVAP